MTSWRVGAATITPVIEVETVTSPRFLFSKVDKGVVLAMAEAAPWLRPSFVDDRGYLLQRIQCLVIEMIENFGGGNRTWIRDQLGEPRDALDSGHHSFPVIADRRRCLA